jgi:hypothetical protein
MDAATGKVSCQLLDTPGVTVRVGDAMERLGDGGGDKLASLAGCMDNAVIAGNAVGYDDPPKKDPIWDAIVRKDNTNLEVWRASALRFMPREVADICRDVALSQTAASDAVVAIVASSTATAKILPFMVKDSSQIGGYALKDELLFDVHRHFQHLDNLLKVVTSKYGNGDHQLCAARAMFPDANESQVSLAFGMDTKGVICAVLTACAAHLNLDALGHKHEDKDQTEQEQEEEEEHAFTLGTVTLEQQVAATGWIQAHWDERIRPVFGKQCPGEIPAFNSPAWWKFVGCLLGRVLGFGLRKKTKKKSKKQEQEQEQEESGGGGRGRRPVQVQRGGKQLLGKTQN